MRRFVSLIIVLVLAVSALVGCGATEKDYNLAIGVEVTETLASSKVANTVAAIVTDAEGKIVLCRIDCVEYSAFDREGAIVTTAPVSKVAQGEDYDKNNYMAAGDWYKQAQAFENFVVGMTRAEVAAIATEGGKPTDAELKAGCTIGITDILAAVDNAFASEHKTAFKSAAEKFTAGLSAVSSVSVNEKEDETTNVKLSATFGCSVLADGKVVATILDTAEPELVNVTTDGAASLTYKGTKREQGTAYDAFMPMAAGTWYVQADVYAATATGKTATDIDTLATEGVAGCTIGVTAYKQVIAAAVKAAR